MLSHLHVLASAGDFWSGFRAPLEYLHQYLLARPDDVERIASHLYRTAVDAQNVPKEFRFAYEFDDAFAFAHDGVYGKPEEVRRRFMDQLAQFTSAA